MIRGGQTMNPSVGHIMGAVEESNAKEVVILPNNKNIIVAAEQAAQGETGGRTLKVIPTRSVPQGVAALLAFNPEESFERNLQTMEAAFADVVTIEVTQAIRDTDVGGVSVVTGQFIGLIDGELVVADKTAEAALLGALAKAPLSGDLVVTLYWGVDATQIGAEEVAVELEKQNPGLQVDVAHGGQHHYPYLASVE